MMNYKLFIIVAAQIIVFISYPYDKVESFSFLSEIVAILLLSVPYFLFNKKGKELVLPIILWTLGVVLLYGNENTSVSGSLLLVGSCLIDSFFPSRLE